MSHTLEPEELDKLQSTLVEHIQTSGSMPLDGAHGFLTAVAAHPHIVSEEAARARVLGEIAGEQGIEPILKKFQAQLLHDLENDQYGPLIMQMPRDDGSMLPLPYSWCQGYGMGLASLGETLSARALEDATVAEHLGPIVMFTEYPEHELFAPSDEDAHRAAVARLGDSAIAIFRWWRQQA